MSVSMGPPATPAHAQPGAIEIQPPPTPTTDFAVFEAQKENIQPLNTGRSAAVLGGLYDKGKAEAERVVREGHEKCRREIEEAEKRDSEGEDMAEGTVDVLDPYCKYIAFTNQHHPSSPSILLPMLESTTRKFISDPRFHQDARYLKLWSQYAKLVEGARQEDVWVFLNGKEVGTVWAGFYEDWAGCYEASGRRQQAEDTYKLGINRKAQPLKRLQQQYQAFLSRPAVVAPIPSTSNVLGAASSASTSGRKVLGSRNPSGLSGPSGIAVGTSSSGSSFQHTMRPSNGSRLDVFSDADPASPATRDAEALPWEELGTRDGNRKENERETTGWKGELLKQDKRAMARVAPRTPKLEVFSDEPEPKRRNGDEANAPGGRNKASTDAEALRSNPLRFYTDLLPLPAESLPPMPFTPSNASTTAKPRKPSSHHVLGALWTVPERTSEPNSKGKPEKRMFIWDEVYRNEQEWSFEETRAKALGMSGAGSGGPIHEWEMTWHVPEATGPPKTKSLSPTSPATLTALPIFTDSAPVPVHFESPAASPEPPRAASVHRSSHTGQRAPPSPTVNTKAAMADVMEMLNQDLKGGKAGARASSENDSDSDEMSSSDEEEEEDDDAKATRVHVPQPTPRTVESELAQAGMGMSTPGAFIPPTPTPAQGYLSSRRDPAFGAFSVDENPPPQSSIKAKVFQDDEIASAEAPPRMMVFSDEVPRIQPRLSVFSDENAVPGPSKSEAPFGITPAKARVPFGMKTPLTSKPAAVETELEDTSEGFAANLAMSRASFETPIRPMQRAKPVRPHNIFAPTLSGADEQQEGDEEGANPAQAEHHEYEEEIDRPGRQRQVMALGRHFNAMTPITERTCEYTSSTIANGLRSSTSSALTAGTRNFTRALDSDDEADNRQTDDEEDGLIGALPTRESDLSMVKEESEHTSSTAQAGHAHGIRSPSPTVASSTSRRSSAGFERSGTIDSPFRLPAGYTIQNTVRMQETDNHPAASSAPIASVAEARLGNSKGVPTNPCCPTDSDLMESLIGALHPPLAQLAGFEDLRCVDGNHLTQLQKTAKSRGLSASTKSSSNEAWLMKLGSKMYEVEEKIGEGGFGAVFKAIDLEARDIADEASDCGDEDDLEDQFVVAVKVERPANVWESLILDRVRSRLPDITAASVIKSRGLYCYQDESVLLLDYHSQGTLLDAVNKAPTLGIASAAPGAVPSMDELPAIFFTIELLKVVEELHRADFIHGDLKIDNCLIRLSSADIWSAQYDRSGENGWSKKGVRLIDFGRAADMRMYPAGRAQEFIADWTTDERDCPEMREGKPWSYQTDYCGLASICYCMLFGRFIATEEVAGPSGATAERRFKISGALKRYWQTDLWNELFNLLLNSKLARPDGILPIMDELAAVRHKFEDWLEANCQKNGKSLKSMLSKVEMASMR